MPIPDTGQAALTTALRVIDAAWEEVRRGVYVQQDLGEPPARLPEVSETEAQRRSGVGRGLLERLEKLDLAALPHDIALTLRLVRFRASSWAREGEWYWTVVDPLGVGFYGMFMPTAYTGGFLLSGVHQMLAAFRFTEHGDLDRYLALAADYARLVDQMSARTAGQAARGMRMPKVQLVQARELLKALRVGSGAALRVMPARLASVEGTAGVAFAEELERRITQGVEPAFDRALAALGAEYEAAAPEAVGLGQYPDGREIYAELVRTHTTLNFSPEQVHARGLERMARIQAGMASIRAEVGFHGDGKAYQAQLDADPRWRADTTEGVKAVFQRYIDRLAPRYDEYFPVRTKATYGVEALPEALQASMTFGYYDAARRDRPHGNYLFNSANLTKQSLYNIGALNYHELVPGHHLHLSSQRENESLHPFRTHSFVNAYNEGWAEYASTFAGEIGMYPTPEERYGRLVMDAFLTCRLVVDTGMNALGWSLERARDYMRAWSGMAEREILTETIRYSCDIPGQALAYKLGDTEILALRERAKQVLGPRFSLKDFHGMILGPGALPMPELAWHVERELERRIAPGVAA